MSRTLVAWIAALSLVSVGGCTMCTTPYDQVSPVVNANCGGPCVFSARAGSILEGSRATAVVPEALPAEVAWEDLPPAPEAAEVPKPVEDPAIPAEPPVLNRAVQGDGWKPSGASPGAAQPPAGSRQP